MAEAARRTGNGLGADVARRLIARPLRLQGQRPTAPTRAAAPVADEDIVVPAADPARRLAAENLVMKAVIKAERRENALLRAAVGADSETTLGDEARAVRDRWAGIVDRLLLSAR